jgi:hypothetical protein
MNQLTFIKYDDSNELVRYNTNNIIKISYDFNNIQSYDDHPITDNYYLGRIYLYTIDNGMDYYLILGDKSRFSSKDQFRASVCDLNISKLTHL